MLARAHLRKTPAGERAVFTRIRGTSTPGKDRQHKKLGKRRVYIGRLFEFNVPEKQDSNFSMALAV